MMGILIKTAIEEPRRELGRSTHREEIRNDLGITATAAGNVWERWYHNQTPEKRRQ